MWEDCVTWFVDEMRDFEKDAMAFYYDEKRLQCDALLAYEFNYEMRCHICKKPFNADHTDKVREHDHVTVQYRGAAHKWCYIRLPRTCKITIFFHNFRGYDSHFIVMAMKDYPRVDIKVIGQGMEKYLTISLGKYLVFKDSLQFLGSSLATLDKNQKKTGLESFVQLRKKFHGFEAQDMRLLVRKGVDPYEYMDSWEKMDERQLPPNEAVYSKLTDTDISDEDYQHALKLFESFKCGTMRIYRNLYMMSMCRSFLSFCSHFVHDFLHFLIYCAIFRFSLCYAYVLLCTLLILDDYNISL